MGKKFTSGVTLCTHIEAIIGTLNATDLGTKLGDAAYEICKEYRPKIKEDATSKIKHPKDKKPYVRYFTAQRMTTADKDTYGAYLGNSIYQLSHLIERPHNTGWNIRTKNEYHIWENVSEPAINEFIKKGNEIVADTIQRACTK